MSSNRTMSRRFFLQCGAAAGAVLAFPVHRTRAAAGTTLEKYIQPLPLPNDGIVVAAQRGVNQ